MLVSREIGLEANTFGRTEGARIAQYLGAENMPSNSNECTVNSVPIVIKCARLRTRSVGVSNKMMNRIQAILAAFANTNGGYNLYWLDLIVAKQYLRPRLGKLEGKESLIDKSVFINYGHLIHIIPSTAVLSDDALVSNAPVVLSPP